MAKEARSGVSPIPLVVGLVGGIGSGKSQVAALLAERGGKVIAADDLGHEALRQPDLRDRVALPADLR